MGGTEVLMNLVVSWCFLLPRALDSVDRATISSIFAIFVRRSEGFAGILVKLLIFTNVVLFVLFEVGTMAGCDFFSNDFISIQFEICSLASAGFRLILCRHVVLSFSCSFSALGLNNYLEM